MTCRFKHFAHNNIDGKKKNCSSFPLTYSPTPLILSTTPPSSFPLPLPLLLHLLLFLFLLLYPLHGTRTQDSVNLKK